MATDAPNRMELVPRDDGQGFLIPGSVQDRVDRGKRRLAQIAPEREECLRFWRGDQFVYRNRENWLVKQGTVQGEKPSHRIRRTYNLLVDVVRHEVSQASSRTPSYEINPSTVDPEDISAARLSEKVAVYGYDAWHVRRATVDAVTYAIVADEGFVWPYFDPSIPPYIDDKGTGIGDIRLRVFGPNEVFWEPGVQFEDSRWHCIMQARPVDQVKDMPGYLGGDLSADADSEQLVNTGVAPAATKLVMTFEYLERPSPSNETGVRLVIANGRVVCEPEAYPCIDTSACPVDEPVLHRISYIQDPGSDRDMGLIRHTLDAQRIFNNCWNRETEWMQLALNPQVLAPTGSLTQRITDEPGAVFQYNPVGGNKPEWRDTPNIPNDLARMKDEAKATIGMIASQNDIPSQVEAGSAIQVLTERDANARQAFLAALAEFHSRLMRHCLYLVQRHYTEPRLLQIRGRFGPEQIKDFRGADLRGQCDVTVLPGSIAPRTRQEIERRVQWIAATFPGYLSPEAAMAALDGGTAEQLIDDYLQDVGRANRVIQTVKEGPEAFMNQPEVPGGPGGELQPGWMPRFFDNTAVHKMVFESWMKTEEYETLPLPMQEAANLYYQGLIQIEQQKAQQAAVQQQQMAEQMGMTNAAKTPAPPSLPSTPAPMGQ